MKRTLFACGLVGALAVPAMSPFGQQASAEEPGLVVIDRIGYTARAQSEDEATPPPAPASEAESEDFGQAPELTPVPEHDQSYGQHHGYGACPGYGMPMHGYGDWTSSPGCAPVCCGCCSDEGLKPTGNPILDAPFELTTALVKGIFCGCRKSCSRCSGCNGNGDGRPHGCHRYHMNYPVNPWYFDRRDGQVYAAEGWGAPMAVPVAPCVRHSYNYSWGIPSSRITPLSRMPGQGGY